MIKIMRRQDEDGNQEGFFVRATGRDRERYRNNGIIGKILPDEDGWMTRHFRGRIDRFDTLADAKSEVRKW